MTDPTPAVRDRVLSLPSSELPAYVYDLAALRPHVAAVRAALPERVELYYAAKANPEPEILGALGPYVDGYEVSSGGELAHVAGAVPGRPLAFGGPGKTPDEVTAALEQGVERFHVESAYELRMLAELARRVAPGRRVPVLPRVNLPVADGSLAGSSLAMGGRPTPFGMDPAQALEAVRALTGGTYPHLELRGVHAHLASGLEAAEQLAVAESVVSWATDLGVPLAEVNVGGGMTVDYTPSRAPLRLGRVRQGPRPPDRGAPRTHPARRAGAGPDGVLRLVRHGGTGREAQPRRGVRRRPGRHPPSAHPGDEGARPAVFRTSGGHLAASVAAIRVRGRPDHPGRTAVHTEGRAGPTRTRARAEGR
ncbi:hypothetical protein QFZ76_008850 [Streptomyces sp. V4I2]|nr:hypothetical protein [Streptomyces sp. V4I2]